MRLIAPAHYSHFMRRYNSGITTLKLAICAPNVFPKLPENQITTNFIYLTSSNFVTISHINYLDQLNSWNNFLKFWNGLLCRNKSGPYPLHNLEVFGRVAASKLVPRNCLRYLQTTLIMGEGRLLSEFMGGITEIFTVS